MVPLGILPGTGGYYCGVMTTSVAFALKSVLGVSSEMGNNRLSVNNALYGKLGRGTCISSKIAWKVSAIFKSTSNELITNLELSLQHGSR